jgi:hypothetical protein
MTATADGFHCGSCTGEIVVTNSVFEYSHDDSFNIKGAYGKAISATPKLLSYDKSKAIPVKAGDVIDLYGASDFKYLGSWTVVEVNEAKATYKTKEIIDVDVTDAYIANDTQINSLTVRNSYFGNKRNRGMLIQCRDVVIEGCTFQNIIHGVLNIFSVADSFAEGIMPRNVVVRNNKFFHNSSSDVNVFTNGPSGAVSNTITGVEVYNNFFWQSQGRPITFKSAGSSKATNNFIYEFRSSLDSAIYVYISENIEISKNYIKGPITNADFEAVKLDGSSTTNIENKHNMKDVYKAN